MATVTAKAVATSNSTYAGWVNGGSVTFEDLTSGDTSQDAGSLLVNPSELEKIPVGSIINSVTLCYTSKVNKDQYKAGIHCTPYYLTSYTITGNTYTYTVAAIAGDTVYSTKNNSTSGYDGSVPLGAWDVSKIKSGMRLAMGIDVEKSSITIIPCDLTISNIRVVIDYTVPTYTVSFNGNGATSGSVDSVTANTETGFNLPTNGFEKKYEVIFKYNSSIYINDQPVSSEQYDCDATFNGWEDHGTITASNGEVFTAEQFDAPFYANTYSDLYNAFGYNKQSLVDHYVSNGRNEGRSCTGNPRGVYPASATVSNLANGGGTTTLYAQWSEISSVEMPTLTRDGHTFLGWYTAESGGTKVGDGGDSYTPTGNITLYAHWKTNSTNMIYIGTKQPTFYIGTKQVQSIYLGMSLIYEIVQIVDSGTCGSNLTYTLDSHGVLTISGTGDMQNSSFGWDKNLIKSVVINYGVTNIGQGAFEDCTGLTSITIPNGVTSIGWNAFRNCTSLTSITIPDSVTSIGVAAFYRCSGLTSVAIPDSITSIGDIAFWDCNGLTSITIPDRVTSIGEGVFAACNNLTKITVSSGNTVYHSTDNCLIETETKTLISGCKSSIIPTDGSVTSIGNRTFEGCSGLTSVTIPNGVTSIGWRAFWSCFDLTRVIIPNSVTNIGDWAFQSCSCLTSITIPDSVTSIGEGAFKGCAGLTSITIPSSVTSIGDSMFRDCTNLTEIDFSTHTTVPTLNSTNAFSNTPANLVIKVPSDLLDEWKAATNWVAYADKIVGFK